MIKFLGKRLLKLINLTNNDEALIQQYFNSQNLSTRIYLHDHFSINKEVGLNGSIIK